MTVDDFLEFRSIISPFRTFNENDFLVQLDEGNISYDLEKFYHDKGWDRLLIEYIDGQSAYGGLID